MATGDYYEAALETNAGSLNLSLLDRNGNSVRRLLTQASGRHEFRLIAETSGQSLLLQAGSKDVRYALHTLRHLPPPQQIAPAPAYLSPRIAALADTLLAGGNSDAFWQQISREGSPMVEAASAGEYTVTFLWRGARRSVRLFGGPGADHDSLQRLRDSDVWFRSYTLPASTRLAYKLAPDVPEIPGTPRERRVAILATAQADPFNPRSWPDPTADRFNRHSLLELPQAPAQPWHQARGAKQGSLQRWQQTSALLGNSREITLYRPVGFNASHPGNLLLFVFDAPEYLSRVPTPTLLDNLIAAGRLPPVVAVFIANPDPAARARELPDNPTFARFMAEELLPRVIDETGLAHDPARTALAGSSYGGLASASVALHYPQQFGNVISLSGSFWWSPAGTAVTHREYIAARVAGQPRLPLRFFLSAGLFETSHGDSASILDTSRHLRDVLTARGYPVIHHEYAGGHDYLIWRGALADGLLALFDRKPSPTHQSTERSP